MRLRIDHLRAVFDARADMASSGQSASIAFRKDGGRFDEKRIGFVVMKDNWYYGSGFTLFEEASYCFTVSDETLDAIAPLFQKAESAEATS